MRAQLAVKLLPGGGRGEVEHDDERVLHPLERLKRVVARLDPGLPLKGGVEVEEQRRLSEQPRLRGQLCDPWGRHPLTEFGHVLSAEAARPERAPRRPGGQKGVAAKRQDHNSTYPGRLEKEVVEVDVGQRGPHLGGALKASGGGVLECPRDERR